MSLSSLDIDLVGLAGLVGDQAEQGSSAFPCEHLDDPPEKFMETFSAYLGDTLHTMNRPKVAVKHEFKKPYCVALQVAFLAWRPELLADVKETLASNGFSKEDIDALMYYDVDFFRERVDRRVLPPRQLYWRVCAAFVIFGNKVDSKTNKPLFLRMYYERWKRNQRIKDVVKSSKTELQLLQHVNNEHMLLPSGTLNRTSAPDENTDDFLDFGSSGPIDDGGDDAGATHEREVPRFAAWVDVAAATPMSQPQYRAIRPHQQLGPPIVGGLLIGLTPDNLPTALNRKRGQPGKDVCARKKRSCARCVKFKGRGYLSCVGRIGNKGPKACQFFTEDGEIIVSKNT